MDTHAPSYVIPPCEHRGAFQMEPAGKKAFVNRAYCMTRGEKVLPVTCRVCVHDARTRKT